MGAIVYKVEDDIGCPESPQCDILMKAMDHYHKKSCIKFKEWSGEDNYVQIFFNRGDSGACWSPVGRVGKGPQRLSLGQRCWYLGIVIHELGHAAGFWHEMNRPDRDDWIYIYWNNIIPNFAHAFAKHDSHTVNNLGETFDYKSIMMYDEYAFSKNGVSPTLQAKTGYEIGPIWKKPGLSNSDVRRIHKLYSCKGAKAKDGFPYDTICTFNKHTCGFKNGDSSIWNWRSVNETDGYLYSTFESAGTTPGYLVSINFHNVAKQDKMKGPLGCVRFWYMIQSDSSASLKLSQAFLERVTQLNNDPETTFELWSNDTNSGNWIHVEIPLYVTRPFKLIFEAQFVEDNTYGTIALDDFELLYTECTGGEVNSPIPENSALDNATSQTPLVTTPIAVTNTMQDLFDTKQSIDVSKDTEHLQLL
ncbi:meprin A subunit beta-like [Cimex lectularius]|uniref:Metalloendopeptidase n=1 Tax=Cimex lectularius TaxID=79782 RepID=A0A8I6TIK1_CIMLE|nr:meprin A subunit beta-like [Cimex lectularius]